MSQPLQPAGLQARQSIKRKRLSSHKPPLHPSAVPAVRHPIKPSRPSRPIPNRDGVRATHTRRTSSSTSVPPLINAGTLARLPRPLSLSSFPFLIYGLASTYEVRRRDGGTASLSRHRTDTRAGNPAEARAEPLLRPTARASSHYARARARAVRARGWQQGHGPRLKAGAPLCLHPQLPRRFPSLPCARAAAHCFGSRNPVAPSRPLPRFPALPTRTLPACRESNYRRSRHYIYESR